MYTREISNSIYTKKDLAEARQAFVKYLSVQVLPVSKGRVLLTIKVKSEYLSQEREVILEFFNYLMDTSIQRDWGETVNG